MNNKKIIILFVIVLFVIIIGILLFANNNKNGVNNNTDDEDSNVDINYRNPEKAPDEYTVYNDIHKKMDNKESFLVYFTNKDPNKCKNCKLGDSIIDYYESIYDLEFLYFDTSYTKHLIKLNEEFGVEERFILPPAVAIFKDGMQEATVTAITVGDSLKEFLSRYGFITKDRVSKENDLNTDEKFNNVFNSKNNNLIVMYSGLNNDLRIKLYNVTKNKVNYYYIFNYNVTYYNYQSIISREIGDMIKNTMLVIVNSGKVIDYLEYDNTKEDEIEAFLRKNKIIN